MFLQEANGEMVCGCVQGWVENTQGAFSCRPRGAEGASAPKLKSFHSLPDRNSPQATDSLDPPSLFDSDTLTNLVISIICLTMSVVKQAFHDELKFLDVPENDVESTE